jgi:DNA-binding HxlR family transcriptional regulator
MTIPQNGLPACSPDHRKALELIGRRWAGAILSVLHESRRPLRYSEIIAAIPGLSDRLCSIRLKELESEGLLERIPQEPQQVSYVLTDKSQALGPFFKELQAWAKIWLATRA